LPLVALAVLLAIWQFGGVQILARQDQLTVLKKPDPLIIASLMMAAQIKDWLDFVV